MRCPICHTEPSGEGGCSCGWTRTPGTDPNPLCDDEPVPDDGDPDGGKWEPAEFGNWPVVAFFLIVALMLAWFLFWGK